MGTKTNVLLCAHSIPLDSFECANCTGPLTDVELDMIRRRLAGHVPRCDRAPSSETARLMATIDALAGAIGAGTVSPAQGAVGRLVYQDDSVMVCKVTLAPAAVWPEDAHPDHSETILRTAGKIMVGLLDGPTLLVEDCFAFIERGERHTVRNMSKNEPAECISVMRRA